ncbi:MAG: glycosyltransferase family 2 protein [Patescibacteria group bacterium]
MKDLSIIIVNYNSKDFVLKCIKSIKDNYTKELKNNEYEIIVVDNASSDNSREVLEKEKDITFIYNSKNLGFSKANNAGIKKSSGRYVLFLNPDTIVYKDTIRKMIDFMEKEKQAGAATCKVVMGNGEIDDATHRGFPTPWNSLMFFTGLSRLFPKSKVFNGYHMGWLDMNKTHKIDALAGAFMLVRRTAGEEVNWWDEDYFFYGEDLDFCYMLKQKGWKIYYVANASIFHHKGVSGGIKKVSQNLTTANKETKLRVTKWRYKAMEIFYDKHYKDEYPFFITYIIKSAIKVKLWKSLREINKK